MGIKDSVIYKDIVKPLKIKLIRNPYNKYIKQPYRKYKQKYMDDESFFMQRHKDIFGYRPDFKNPKTFNEKIIHRILYDRNPIHTALADKLRARIYIAVMLYPLYSKELVDSNTHTILPMNKDSVIGGSANIDNAMKNNNGGGGQYSLLDSSLLHKDNVLLNNSPLFFPIDSIRNILFDTNACIFLPKLYGIYKSVNDIDFDLLPESFVLKTNHDCGGVVIVENKEDFLKDTESFNKAMDKLTWHLQTNYYELSREYHYKDIEPRVFAEELLGSRIRDIESKDNIANANISNNAGNIESSIRKNATQESNTYKDNNSSAIKLSDTYKFHMFSKNDKDNFIQVTTDRFTNYQRVIMDYTWNKAPFGFLYNNSEITRIPNKPQGLDLMFSISHLLGDPFDYVRVDLYDVDSRIYVGELTFTHAGGTEPTHPREWDAKLGTLWSKGGLHE